MATTYTIATVNGKIGSIVLTPSVASDMPQYFLNIKSAKLRGENPFLADGVTNNPKATISLFSVETTRYFFKDIQIGSLTAIGGSAAPASLAGCLTAIAALIAE